MKRCGCLFPFCSCESRLGCAYERYDLRKPHNEPTTIIEPPHRVYQEESGDYVEQRASNKVVSL